MNEPLDVASLWTLFEQVMEGWGPEWRIESLLTNPENAGPPWPPGETPARRAEALRPSAASEAGRSFAWAFPLSLLSGLGGGLAREVAKSLAGPKEHRESSAAGWLWRGIGGGFGLVPLIAGLWGLFGGRKQQELPELARYVLPPPVRVAAAYQEGSRNPWVGEVNYDERSRPRAAGLSTGSDAGPRQVVVQVNALDTQSFLDRSDEIALAVRRAMLNMNPLNDVVADL